jgi:phage protein D
VAEVSEEVSITVPAFKIEVDGSEISPETIAAVESVQFEEEINTASMFVIKLSTPEFYTGAWRFIDLESFSLGSEVKLYMGMGKLVSMIVGEITSLEPSFRVGSSTIEVRGYDRLHRLRFGRNRRTFVDMKDSEIASQIASERGLSADLKDTGTKHPYLFQNNQSDLEFLLYRAKRIRYEVFVNDKTLYFRPAQENDSVSMFLEYRVDIDDFSVKLSARYEGSEFVVRGWDFMKKEPLSAKAQKGNEISLMSAKESGMKMTESAFGAFSSAMVDEYLVDTADAEKVAIARYNTQLVESVTGEGRCAGIPELRAGKTIEIKGVGRRFSGTYYVTATTHSIDDGGYYTSFKVRRAGV